MRSSRDSDDSGLVSSSSRAVWRQALEAADAQLRRGGGLAMLASLTMMGSLTL